MKFRRYGWGGSRYSSYKSYRRGAYRRPGYSYKTSGKKYLKVSAAVDAPTYVFAYTVNVNIEPKSDIEKFYDQIISLGTTLSKSASFTAMASNYQLVRLEKAVLTALPTGQANADGTPITDSPIVIQTGHAPMPQVTSFESMSSGPYTKAINPRLTTNGVKCYWFKQRGNTVESNYMNLINIAAFISDLDKRGGFRIGFMSDGHGAKPLTASIKFTVSFMTPILNTPFSLSLQSEDMDVQSYDSDKVSMRDLQRAIHQVTK